MQSEHKDLLRLAFVGLLRSEVRLDTPGAKLPETLEADASRLATARDVIDRVALVATLCVFVRQVSDPGDADLHGRDLDRNCPWWRRPRVQPPRAR